MTASAPPTAAPRSPWFHSAAFDLTLILCVPLLTWPLVTAAGGTLGAERVGQLILLTATGHYFATFVRTYGDRDLFRRFRTRFVLAPVVLLATCAAAMATGHAAELLLTTAAWGFWHWLAQAFGFARIYDIKAGSFHPRTALLDKALVIVGFVSAVVLNDGALAEFARLWAAAGMPLTDAAGFAAARTATLALSVLVGAAYVANLAADVVRGRPWSWQKQLMHVTTIGYYWFAFAWLPNVLVAYALYELFHDVQYYAITWLTCRNRAQRPGVTRWLRSMFRPGVGAALVFVLATTAFGAIDLTGRHLVDAPGLRDATVAVFLTAALLHYYYDGFVWKAREQTLGADLGISGGLGQSVVPALRHAGRWALFYGPLALLVLFGQRGGSERERLEALVALAPGDFLNQSNLGLELMKAGDVDRALAHYRAAIALHPDLASTRANYGSALDLIGRTAEAREQYEAALASRDDGSHARAHTNLGVLLLAEGERDAARRHLDAGRQLGGEHPAGRLIGLAELVAGNDAARGQRLYECALELDPNAAQALFGLGLALLQQRRFAEALPRLERLAQLQPEFVPGLLALARTQASLDRRDAARATVQQVLRLDPRNGEALELRARLGG